MRGLLGGSKRIDGSNPGLCNHKRRRSGVDLGKFGGARVSSLVAKQPATDRDLVFRLWVGRRSMDLGSLFFILEAPV